jgi:disulfide bond formation protein DsbB
MTRRPEKAFALAALAACAAALLVAQAAQHLLGFIPCEFCLLERWPYRIGIVVATLAWASPRRPARVLLWGLVAILLAACGLSLTHTGVELHWWPDPIAACSVPDLRGMTIAQRLAAMPARPAKSCSEPDFLIPGLPVSMTQMGLIYALAVCLCLAICLSRSKGRFFR